MLARRFPAITGALALAILAAVLPLGLRLSNDTSELSVTLRAASPSEVIAQPGAPLAAAVAGPPALLPRLDLAGDPDRVEPGLAFRTWRLVYGHRWERAVTTPVLTGPFDPEGSPWPCAFAVRLGPRFFDDGKPGGNDVESIVDRVVRAQFPIDAYGLHFAEVANTQLRVRPVDGAIEVEGGVTLADGGRRREPTRFQLKARIALAEKNGDLEARLRDVQVAWTGHTRSDPLVQLADLFMDVDVQARSMVAERLRGALSILKLPKDPFPLFDDRPDDRLTLRLCGAPLSRPDGLTVSLRVIANLAEPRLDPRVPGPTHLEAPPDPAAVEWGSDEPAAIEAVATAAAAHQALYLMWQSGEFARWGKRREVVSAMQRKLEERVTLDVTAIEPRLPPTVDGVERGAFRVRFGDMEVGRLDDGRRVVGNGDLLATARIDKGRLGASAALTDLRVTCVEGAALAWRLRPCLSDVVPVLREGGISSEGIPLDLALPDRLLRMNLVLGTELAIDGLEAETRGSPPVLHLRAGAKLVPRKAR